MVVTGAILLLAAAGLLLLNSGTSSGQPGGAASHATVSVADFDWCPEVVWKRYRVSIGGRQYEFEGREYPKPLNISSISVGAIPSEMHLKNPILALVHGVQRSRQVEGWAGIEAQSRLFDDPKRAMAWFEDVQAKVGGWDKLARGIHDLGEKEWSGMQVIAEVRTGPYHVLVVSVPDIGEPTFRPMRRLDNGEYRHLQELDENIRPLLYNSRVLQIWERPKPGRG
jgi:hypothetical protein